MTEPLLQMTGISKAFGGVPALSDAALTIHAGEVHSLVGQNGAGKSTLIKILTGVYRRDAGTVRWQGADVVRDLEAWRGRLAWLGHLDGLKGDLTVAENLLVAQQLRGGQADGLDGALVAFDLGALAARPVRTLSAGQRRRTALARVVLSAAVLWLLDEPLNALDTPAQQAFRTVLQTHLAAGGLAIAATHADLGITGARTLELGSFLPPRRAGS